MRVESRETQSLKNNSNNKNHIFQILGIRVHSINYRRIPGRHQIMRIEERGGWNLELPGQI
jgi:hypothetical protein